MDTNKLAAVLIDYDNIYVTLINQYDYSRSKARAKTVRVIFFFCLVKSLAKSFTRNKSFICCLRALKLPPGLNWRPVEPGRNRTEDQ